MPIPLHHAQLPVLAFLEILWSGWTGPYYVVKDVVRIEGCELAGSDGVEVSGKGFGKEERHFAG